MNNQFSIKISKESMEPFYLQLASQLQEKIKNGEIVAGSKLPSERELAEQLSLSRGTVKKSYLTLVQLKKAVAIKGRGTFIAEAATTEKQSRLKIANAEILRAITVLEDIRFSHSEISALFNSIISQRSDTLSNVVIAILDCNPEALQIYQKQIARLSNVKVVKILIDDFLHENSASSQLEPFDLVITTSNHYKEILEIIPSISDKLIQVGVAPSAETLVNISSINPGTNVGILYFSKKFKQVISSWLMKFSPSIFYKSFSLSEDKKIDDFMKKATVAIVPPGFVLTGIDKTTTEALLKFRQNGGKILNFEYNIEHGSLMHLEEVIKELVIEKSRQGN